MEIAKTFEGRVEDGDVFLCNSPYSKNTHVGDLVTAAPVFADGELRFWSVTKGHQMDTGAFVPSSVTASAQNIWQEGLQIPPMKWSSEVSVASTSGRCTSRICDIRSLVRATSGPSSARSRRVASGSWSSVAIRH